MKNSTFAAIALLLIVPSAIAGPLTPDAIRRAIAIATEARSSSTSPTDALRIFRQRMDDAFGPDPTIPLAKSDQLTVLLFTQLSLLRAELTTKLRKLEPLGDVSPHAGIGIYVAPQRINAPDISKVVLMRNGQIVAPLNSTLETQSLRTALGAVVSKHAGVVEFPESAFAEGARVHISLIPESGENIEIELSPERLMLLSATDAQSASTLLQKSADDVRQRLGNPSAVDGHRWRYTTPVGTLELYFDDNNIITDVQPRNFNLAVIRR